jgi:hypothetical protein
VALLVQLELLALLEHPVLLVQVAQQEQVAQQALLVPQVQAELALTQLTAPLLEEYYYLIVQQMQLQHLLL